MLLGTEKVFYNDKKVTPLRTYREKKGEINMPTIILRDSKTPLSVMDRTSKEMNKKIEDVHNTMNQRHDRHLQNASLNNCRSHILLRYTRNILKDRPSVRS